jgi:hypothetical protein
VKSVCGQQERPPYRLYEVQNGNRVEAYQDTFPQLELIEPHAQHAFRGVETVRYVGVPAALAEPLSQL